MRTLRERSGVSLREVERRSGRGRGNLSQVETGKARPNRSLVEWYDEALHGDGLLLGLYFEARTGHSLVERSGPTRAGLARGDSFDVIDTTLPQGALVRPGEPVEIGWTLANTGSLDWSGRSLLRIGAHAGPRLLGSPALSAVPDCVSGAEIDLRITVHTPCYESTCVAYWQMVDGQDPDRLAAVPHLSVQLVVRG